MQRRCAAINYYIINEELARRAKEMNSFYDYKEGSATAEYRRSVDAAARIAEEQKRQVDPIHRVVAKSAKLSFRLAAKTAPAPLLLLFPPQTLRWFAEGVLRISSARNPAKRLRAEKEEQRNE